MLTTNQIQRVSAYILSEASCGRHDNRVTSNRIKLLLRCCCTQGHLLRAVVDYLNVVIKKDGYGVTLYMFGIL